MPWKKCAATGPTSGFTVTVVEWGQFVQSELGPTFPHRACTAIPLGYRIYPANKLNDPVAFRSASYRDPGEGTADTQVAEMGSTAAERYHLGSERTEVQTGEWFEWCISDNTVPCGTHGEVCCLPRSTRPHWKGPGLTRTLLTPQSPEHLP